ncbi:MAG: tetratricopeptide repeat protein [Sedimentisphaerales bacterium]
MAGKSVLCLVSGILLFSIIVPVCPADEVSELYQVKEHICQLIEAGKYSEAKVATDKMTIEYAGQEKLPEMLYWIAERYQRFDRFEDAKQICQKIIRDFPESPWANKAKFYTARMDIMLSISAQDYNSANEQIEKLAVDYKDNSDLPEALFWLAERYIRVDKFDEAKQNYQRIIENYPNSPFANKAKLWLSRANVTSLVVQGNYAEAREALDKLVTDFAKSPDLPGILYWLTERYERVGRAEDAKRNYQRLIDQFPNNPYAKKAKMGIPRADIVSLIESKDFNNADKAINKMSSDFASHPDLPKTLYWLAVRYQDIGRVEDANRLYQQITQNYANTLYASKAQAALSRQRSEGSVQQDTKSEIRDANDEKAAVEIYRIARGYEDSNQFDLASQTYERVIKEYPGTIKAGNAVLDIRRVEIEGKFDGGDMNTAEKLLDKFAADFNQNPYATFCLDQLAEKYYLRAVELKKEDKPLQARDFFAGAERIWQQIIDIYLSNAAKAVNSAADNNTSEILGKAYYYAAGCRQFQENWDGALKYFQKVVDNYPGFENACGAQAAVGWCYEKLGELNEVPKEIINPLAEESYKAVLENYKDCNEASYAAYRLGELSEEKGNKADEMTYYRKFLTLADPNNEYIKQVKEKLFELEWLDEQLNAKEGAGK